MNADRMKLLKTAFAEFKQDPTRTLQVRIRRERSRELREWLSSVAVVETEAFNREVSNFETSTLLNGKDIKGTLFGDGLESEEFRQQVSLALDNGSLKLHGNYIWGWGSATRVFGAPIKASEDEKRAYIRTAIDILKDGHIPPVEKAKQIQDIKGFGPNIATGIVMIAHPEEFAIWNRPSKEALSKLGYEASELSRFQDAVRTLKDVLGADDFLELDLFLYLTSLEEKPIPLSRVVTGSPALVRSWAISLGEGGRLWKQCLKAGIIAIGWDFLGDLKQYATKDEIADAIVKHGKKNGQYPINDSRCCYQFACEMQAGDRVFAKKGMDQLYGIGVIEADYEYAPDRSEYHHIRRVRWEQDGGWPIPDHARVPLKTLTEVTDYQKFQAFVSTVADNERIVKPTPPAQLEPYTIESAMSGLFVSEGRFKQVLDSLSRKKNVILQGPPGVGKTFIAKRLALAQIGEKDRSKVANVQFHQSYSYEDFIQGWRPKDGVGFERRNGVFHEFCKRAERDPNSNYVFVIDEINRGNLSRIFGELLMLIEADKRGPEFAMPLTYAQSLDETFFVPSNVYIIGMMNTADRSLAMVDYALRRRFTFIDLRPAFDSDRFSEFLAESGVDSETLEVILARMVSLNERIRSEKTNLGLGFEIGHSFFCPSDNDKRDELGLDWYRSIIDSEIAPLLREYWFDDTDKAEQLIEELRA